MGKSLMDDFKDKWDGFQNQIKNKFERVQSDLKKIQDKNAKNKESSESKAEISNEKSKNQKFIEKIKFESQEIANQWKDQGAHLKELMGIDTPKFPGIKKTDKLKKEAISKYKEMQSSMGEKISEFNEQIKQDFENNVQYSKDLRNAFTNSWKDFVDGQKEIHEKFNSMSKRLFWRGYLDFIGAIGLILLIFYGGIWVLKYLGIM